MIGFDQAVYNVFEPEGPVTLRVSVSGVLQRSVQVSFFTTDGTATSSGSVDYVAIPNLTLQFDENTLSQSVTIVISDDSILEDNENFFGSLSSSDNAVDLTPRMATINIFDLNDGRIALN